MPFGSASGSIYADERESKMHCMPDRTSRGILRWEQLQPAVSYHSSLCAAVVCQEIVRGVCAPSYSVRKGGLSYSPPLAPADNSDPVSFTKKQAPKLPCRLG